MTQVMTVLGPIAADELGSTLPHEHLFLDTYSWPGGKGASAGGIIDPDLDWALIVEELEAYRSVGGRSIVDLSLDEIGRAPEPLARLSRATDVHVVMGCGWYRDSYHPDATSTLSANELADILVGEFVDGVGDTGVKPGVIGEIGIESGQPTAREERALRASGLAHHRTGLAITTHTPIRRSGLEALRILTSEGVPPEKIIIGHADSYPVVDYLLALLREGAYVQFDCVAWSYRSRADMPLPPEPLADLTAALVRQGHSERLLLSNDVSHRSLLRYYDGPGFTCITDRFVALLRERGVEDEQIETIMVENPARVLGY